MLSLGLGFTSISNKVSGPAILISAIAGDDYITAAEYAAVTISGTSRGIADAETLTLSATDGTNNWAGTATVSGNSWTAAPVIDMTGWLDGDITVTVELDSDPTIAANRGAVLWRATWLQIDKISTLFTDSAGTTPVTADGDPVGLAVDEANGNDGIQATSAARPTYRVKGGVGCLESDFVDDCLTVPNTITTGNIFTTTPYGYQKSLNLQLGSESLCAPLNWASELLVTPPLSASGLTRALSYMAGSEYYMIALNPDGIMENVRQYSDGTTHTVQAVDSLGVTATFDIGTNSNVSLDFTAAGLTAPVLVMFPLVSSVVTFYCNSNQLAGSISDLTNNINLVNFNCSINKLTGSIPDLINNVNLAIFNCYNNQLTGSIPDLTNNVNLVIFSCQLNQLTGFAGGTVSATLGTFRAENNLLTQAAIDALLAAFVAAGRTIADGTCVINLGGTGNAAPSAAGLTDVATLQGRGWTVATN